MLFRSFMVTGTIIVRAEATDSSNVYGEISIDVQGMITDYPEMYLFGDAIPGSAWGVPPTNPIMFNNNQDGTYSITLTTGNGFFAIIHEDAFNCPENSWECLNSYRYGPSEDGIIITNQTVPVFYPAAGAFQINAGVYRIVMDHNNNTIFAATADNIELLETIQSIVYSKDGTIYVENSHTFIIYDMLGRDVTTMNGNLKGVFVVQVDNYLYKVVVR